MKVNGLQYCCLISTIQLRFCRMAHHTLFAANFLLSVN